jgi:hypothetical protein
MAFKKVSGGSVIKIEKGTELEGYLVGHRIVKSKVKGQRDSVVYELKSASGEKTEFWGNGVVNNALLEGNGKRISPAFKGYLMQFIGGKKVPSGKGKNPMQTVDILVDTDKKLKS